MLRIMVSGLTVCMAVGSLSWRRTKKIAAAVLQKQPALLLSSGEKNKRGCECFWRGGREPFLE